MYDLVVNTAMFAVSILNAAVPVHAQSAEWWLQVIASIQGEYT